ncbi:unnamed protein product, partial [Microthlaspi erraticum]
MESRVESLPHDVVEVIMERLPAKSLMRFKAVSKQWRTTIESPSFPERQLKHGQQQSGDDTNILMVSEDAETGIQSLRTLVLVEAGFVVNPTTRWSRPVPLCKVQQLAIDLGESYSELGHSPIKFGFGKDRFTGAYKLVCLYNSSEISLENATTCEVFDFSTNAWRYVTPASPYRIVGCPDPAFVDGSLYWFTDCAETKVVSFDLHTEAFQVVAQAPFYDDPDPDEFVMCNLDNRLCMSRIFWDIQVVWSFNSGNKTWDKMCAIDLVSTYACFKIPSSAAALSPLTLLE